jgi:hypothetical protein
MDQHVDHGCVDRLGFVETGKDQTHSVVLRRVCFHRDCCLDARRPNHILQPIPVPASSRQSAKCDVCTRFIVPRGRFLMQHTVASSWSRPRGITESNSARAPLFRSVMVRRRAGVPSWSLPISLTRTDCADSRSTDKANSVDPERPVCSRRRSRDGCPRRRSE